MFFYGLTDVGKMRDNNQDNFRICEMMNGAVLAVVCDGMGGAAGGNTASSLAVDTFCSIILQNEKLLFTPDGDLKENTVKNALLTAVNKANTAVYQKSVMDSSLSGMGTTLVACFAYKERIIGINVGDSRMYAVYKDNVKRISKDHSYVQLLVDAGKITEEQAQNHPEKNIIMRAVGVDDSIKADVFMLDADMDVVLLCSDGLSNYLQDEEIPSFFKKDAESDVKGLIDHANACGGNDNITAAVIDFRGQGGGLNE